MADENPGQKVHKANGEYHEAINEVMQNDVPVDAKCKIAAIANEIFARMEQINIMLKEHYDVPEE